MDLRGKKVILCKKNYFAHHFAGKLGFMALKPRKKALLGNSTIKFEKLYIFEMPRTSSFQER